MTKQTHTPSPRTNTGQFRRPAVSAMLTLNCAEILAKPGANPALIISRKCQGLQDQVEPTTGEPGSEEGECTSRRERQDLLPLRPFQGIIWVFRWLRHQDNTCFQLVSESLVRWEYVSCLSVESSPTINSVMHSRCTVDEQRQATYSL